MSFGVKTIPHICPPYVNRYTINIWAHSNILQHVVNVFFDTFFAVTKINVQQSHMLSEHEDESKKWIFVKSSVKKISTKSYASISNGTNFVIKKISICCITNPATKVGFFRKWDLFFKLPNLPKKYSKKNYPELEIWISCLLIWAGISNFKLRIVFWNNFLGDFKNESHFLKKGTFKYFQKKIKCWGSFKNDLVWP